MKRNWYAGLFLLAALYDGILGVVFVFTWPWIYKMFGVTPPNHGGYVVFPALLLIVFGAMFLRISRNPVAHRGLIPYGAGLKAAYSGTVFWYQLTTGVPFMWIPFAWLDLAFLAAFLIAWRGLRDVRPAGAARPAAA
jgi:hypothetical protein